MLFKKKDEDRKGPAQILAGTTAGEAMTREMVVVRREMLIAQAMALLIQSKKPSAVIQKIQARIWLLSES